MFSKQHWHGLQSAHHIHHIHHHVTRLTSGFLRANVVVAVHGQILSSGPWDPWSNDHWATSLWITIPHRCVRMASVIDLKK